MKRVQLEGAIRGRIVTHETRHNFLVPEREVLVESIADAIWDSTMGEANARFSEALKAVDPAITSEDSREITGQ